MTTRSLRDVEVGGWVWIYDKERWNGGPETRRLTKITHIDAKGRLFICTETASDLMENWRYGFKPETGTAKRYENSRIEWASPEEIAQEQERERELERQEQKNHETRRLRRLVEAAAPELLEALRLLQKAIHDEHLLDVKKHFSLCLADSAASKAIAKAVGEAEGAL